MNEQMARDVFIGSIAIGVVTFAVKELYTLFFQRQTSLEGLVTRLDKEMAVLSAELRLFRENLDSFQRLKEDVDSLWKKLRADLGERRAGEN